MKSIVAMPWPESRCSLIVAPAGTVLSSMMFASS
jgi:hypothetical protein